MHLLLIAVTFLIALLWVLNTIDFALGIPKMPAVADTAPLPDEACPFVSIIFAARDEVEKLPGALEKFLALDYPRYEVISVDDRSEDGTAQILEATAQRDSRLKYVRVNSLPPGWLGKPHALEQARQRATGEWLIFTDADVHFAPDLLRRAVRLAQEREWNHLTLLAGVEMHSAGERIVLTYFAMGILIGVRPWRTSDPRSSAYAGVGAFQMIRRSAYETIDGHRRLAMEVVDDMKLGKVVKEAGVRSGVARGWKEVTVRWHAGVRNIVRGTTKNFFAVVGFNFWVACAQLGMVFLLCIAPWVALPFLSGWALAFDAAAVALAVVTEAGVAIEAGISPFYAVTEPLGALIFSWMLLRSTIVTLWSGGITWRGTFYPLEKLRKGVV